MRVYPTATHMRAKIEPDLFTDMTAVLGEGDPTPDVILVRGMPSGWDVGAHKPFMGEDGISIRKALVKEGIKFYTTNVFPFFRPGYNLKVEDGRKAATIVQSEFDAIDCKNFVLFGADAVKLTPYFDIPFRKFNSLLGRTLEAEGRRYRVFPHTSIVTRTPSLYSEFIEGVKDLVGLSTQEKAQTPKSENYHAHTNKVLADKILRAMTGPVACDVETTGLDPYTCRILTVQVSWVEGVGHAFPWDMFTPEEWQGYLGGRAFIFQNGTYDKKVLANNGVIVDIAEDTMLMHSLVDETPGTHSMEHMAHRYLGIDKWSDTVNYEAMEENDFKTLGRYGARDTDITLRLANVFRPMVEGRHIHKVLTDSQNAITRSELRGIRVDREKALQFRLEIEGHLHDKQQYLEDVYGLMNANSPKQVAEMLYTTMGLPVQKEKGKITTNEKALESLAAAAPVVRDILEYRNPTKANGTYLGNILTQTERDGRYHPEFRLAATETGRLAEKLIMLIPRAGEWEGQNLGQQYQAKLRELFIPDDGYVMVGSDYSGLEVSMAAHLTGDEQLIKDIHDKLDTHSAVAIQAFQLDEPLEPYETLKKRVSAKFGHYRDLAKQGTFTWLYGGSQAAIARQLQVESSVAEAILSTLRSRYRGVAAWHEAVRESVQVDSSISTPWGRTRRFFFHSGLERKVTEEQLRESTNSPIQGMSSDMTLAAFTQLEQEGYQTLFPLHDAVYLQVPEDQTQQAMARVKHVMESIVNGPVPFRADVKAGRDWGSLG